MNPFVLAFNAKGINATVHKHSAFQIVFSNDDLFKSTLSNQFRENIFGFIVKPNISHSCEVGSNELCIINIEPCSPAGFFVNSLFNNGKNYILFKSKKELVNLLGIKKVTNLNSSICKMLIEIQSIINPDERINKTVDTIKTNYSQQLSPKILSDSVFLSTSRFSALFKQQTGSSISKYLLWTRIRHAVKMSLTNKKIQLTDIAFKTGFYDLSQLNKYMYAMLGVSPSILRQKSDLVQILES